MSHEDTKLYIQGGIAGSRQNDPLQVEALWKRQTAAERGSYVGIIASRAA
jgi:hypothetical protein